MNQDSDLQPLPGPRLDFLYTNIGRGHPFYLDGILEALVRRGDIRLVRTPADVFQVATGLSRLAWRSARWLYRRGSSPGPVAALYRRLRANANYNRPSFTLNLMGRDIRRRYLNEATPLVVAHPTLVAILRGRPKLVYQHGELVAPSESLVTGAWKVLVPTSAVAQPFISCGYEEGDVVTTGLCVEPPLVKQAEDAFDSRMKRLRGARALVGAFFSSGAEPRLHVEKLVYAARSAVSYGGKVILFARKDGVLARRAVARLAGLGTQFVSVDSREYLPSELPEVLLVRYRSRREENGLVAALFAAFDYFVAPSHERSHWALGLGLPMFVVGPGIGPFAPLNRDVLMAAGVAAEIDSVSRASVFGKSMTQLRTDGTLTQMALAGWGRRPIDGFNVTARFLSDVIGA